MRKIILCLVAVVGLFFAATACNGNAHDTAQQVASNPTLKGDADLAKAKVQDCVNKIRISDGKAIPSKFLDCVAPADSNKAAVQQCLQTQLDKDKFWTSSDRQHLADDVAKECVLK